MTPDIFVQILNGVVGLGVSPIPIAAATEDRAVLDNLEIIGTGFFVTPDVLTNRHVVRAIAERQTKNALPWTQLLVVSVSQASATSTCTVAITTWQARAFIGGPTVHTQDDVEADLGFVRIDRKDTWPTAVKPLEVVDERQRPVTLVVGEPVAICGYPYGSDTMQDALGKGQIVRWGPILHRGYISAHSQAGSFPEVLMDVRIAPGMSGSPIFRPDTGQVIGIVCRGIGNPGGIGSVIGVGQVVTRVFLDFLLDKVREDLYGPPGRAFRVDL